MRRLPRTVIALGLVSLLNDASSEMIYPLLPAFLATVLGAGTLTIGAIEGAAETVAALIKLASGWWSDRLRRRKPLVVGGYALAGATRPLIALSGSAAQVLMLRLADRVGKGIRTAPRDALIADAVDPAVRGRAFGFHRAADHLGAVVGPLVAFVLLRWFGLSLRAVFLLAAVPAALAFVVLLVGVRDRPRGAAAPSATTPPAPAGRLGGRPTGRFAAYLGILLLFTLGNSTDAYLLLRAGQLGVSPSLLPLLWALLNVVKSASSTPGGVLSDRYGRRAMILAGWLLFAVVYFGFGAARTAWQAWVLFAVYGVFFGLTEGVEKALVADLVPAETRGTAFGWYNLVIAVGALPASLLFGAIWEARGAPAAFAFGAWLALLASAALAFLPLPRAPART